MSDKITASEFRNLIGEALDKAEDFDDRINVASLKGISNKKLFDLPDLLKISLIEDERLSHLHRAESARRKACGKTDIGSSLDNGNDKVKESIIEYTDKADIAASKLEAVLGRIRDGFNSAALGYSYEELSDETFLEKLLNRIINNLIKALEPFLDLPGMPEIPFIQCLKDILEALIELDILRRDMSALFPTQITQSFGSSMSGATGDDSLVGYIKDIAILISIFVEKLILFVNFFWLNFLLELIRLLEPVFKYFGISSGTYMNLIFKMYDLLMAIFNLTPFYLLIIKAIWSKIEMVWNMLFTVCPQDKQIYKTENDRLMSLWKTIAKNELHAELCEKTLAEIPMRKNLIGIKRMFDKEEERQDDGKEPKFDLTEFSNNNIDIVEDYKSLLHDIHEKFKSNSVFDLTYNKYSDVLQSEQALR